MKLVTFVAQDSVQQIGALLDCFGPPGTVGCEGSIAAMGTECTIALLQTGAEARDGVPSPYFADMLAFLRGGAAARDQAQAVVDYILSRGLPDAVADLDQVSLLSPVPLPESIRDCMAFEQHIINSIRAVGLKRLAPLDEWLERILGRKRSLAYLANRAWYERPIYYKSNRFSVVGHGAEVRIPAYCQRFDYELEWGVYIGRQGVDIPAERARDYIGGYTLFNDFSARDMQMEEMGGRLGPAKGKDFDTGNAIGPYLVTPDEVPEPYNLTMTARVNGEEWSRGTSADMYWTFEEIIAYVSQSEMLYPGEFFGSGTCSGAQGRGCGLEMGRFLQAGDVVELEGEGLGVLRNTVVGG